MASKSEVMKDEGVKITLGSKEFEVRFDLNALCNLQEKFGDFTKAFDGLEKQDFKKYDHCYMWAWLMVRTLISLKKKLER